VLGAFRRLHDGYVHERRTSVLAARIAELLAPGTTVLDVGAGDGLLARKLLERRPDLTVAAVEVVARPDPRVSVELYDGHELPRANDAVDVTLLVDVLHHAERPLDLLREARRVARRALVVKDVTARGLGASATLQLMERLANAGRGIRMPERFWTPAEWAQAFAELDLTPEVTATQLGLYPFPAGLVFERRFHFVARLRLPG
jgi:SAM-dependent methyltransferase